MWNNVDPIPKTLADKEYLHHSFNKCEFCAISSHQPLGPIEISCR